MRSDPTKVIGGNWLSSKAVSTTRWRLAGRRWSLSRLFGEICLEPGQLGVEHALALHHPGDRVLLRAGLGRAHVDAAELPLDVRGDDLVGRSEIVHDLGDLGSDPRQHLGVLAEHAVGRRVGREVVHLGLLVLAVAVDPADPLLEAVGVERDVEVHQAVAMPLQVDALAGGVGGEQDPDRRLGRGSR